jgi:hypothetical protein
MQTAARKSKNRREVPGRSLKKWIGLSRKKIFILFYLTPPDGGRFQVIPARL